MTTTAVNAAVWFFTGSWKTKWPQMNDTITIEDETMPWDVAIPAFLIANMLNAPAGTQNSPGCKKIKYISWSKNEPVNQWCFNDFIEWWKHSYGILSWNLPDTTPHQVNVTSWPRSTTSQLVRLSVDESNAVRKGVEIVQQVMIRSKEIQFWARNHNSSWYCP